MTLRSFTLLETLAVVVLLGLVAGWALSSIGRSPSPRGIAEQFAAIDAKARVLARTEGPQILTLDDDGVRLEAVGQSERVRSFAIGTPLILRQGGADAERIIYDRLAQSDDFVVHNQDTGVPVLGVYGLTGWTETMTGGRR